MFMLQNDDITKVRKGAKILERMVHQNTFDDIAQGMLKYISQVTH